MSRCPMYDPQTSEARSPWLAGLTEACNKLSGVLDMQTQTFEDVKLPEVFISAKDRFRIYQAPLGNKLWLQTPKPIIKKNGVVITEDAGGFEIDYLGGSIAFSDEKAKENLETDVFTASATYIVDRSGKIAELTNQIATLTEKTGNFKGSFATYNALTSAFPTGIAGDFAIVQDGSTVYVWNETNSQWTDVYKETDLSDYLTKTQIEALLDTKENNIPAKGTTAADDDYYFGGRKTWVPLIGKILGATLSGLVTTTNAEISETDTLLVALGKLQAQINSYLHPILGTSEPTTSTVGKVGQDYINTSNGGKYHLVSVENGVYTWEKYGSGDMLKRVYDPTGKNQDVFAYAESQSAYQQAVAGGYTGTEAEFQALLATGPWLPATDGTVEGELTVMSADGGVTTSATLKRRDIYYKGAPGELAPIKTMMAWDCLGVDGPIHLSDKKITGVANPTVGKDAANKYYVDTQIQNMISRCIFTVTGPVAENETFSLSQSYLPTNPFVGTILFFGPGIRLAKNGVQPAQYQFEQTDWNVTTANLSGSLVYNITINMKALTAIPEGTSVNILLVWI